MFAAAAAGRALLAAWAAAVLPAVLVPGPGIRREDDRSPAAARLVSVVVPARDEARTIGACVAAVLASDHRELELVVVDDCSTDGTADVARRAAAGDPRLTIVPGEPLPDGWVGKPWACAQGAARAGGSWVIFLDADVRLDPAAVRLLLVDAEEHDACAVSWVGLQQLGSFWERAINPVVFFFIASLTPLPLAQRPGSRLVAVNGQLLAFRRSAYDRIGGHAGVHDAVVEDLALARAAKAAFGRGYRFVWARELLTTRMYTNLAEIREGWTKNVALGGAAVGVPPAAVVAGAALGGVGPWVGAAVALVARLRRAPLPPGSAQAAAAAACQVVALGAFGWRFSRQSPLWALTAPLGTLAVAGIAVESRQRARRGTIRWRGRAYAARR